LDVLRAATVVGRAFSVREVALISPGSVTDVVAALGPALRAGIVVEDGELLAFRHDLIREAIYGDLAPAVRRGLHRHLASGLEASGSGLERVAAQLMLGAEAGDGEAIGWLRRAAAEVRASSPAIAADILWRALELSVGTGVPRMGVLVDLVRPLLWTGQAARAEQVCSEALGSGPPADEEPLFWMGLVNSRILQGRFGEARETADRALGCAGLTESDRLHLASARALSGAYQGDAEAVEQARRIAATAPTSIPRGIAQEVVAQWELFTGRADRALAAYEQVDSMRAPAQLESRIWQSSGIRVRMWEAVALLDLDRIEDAAEVLEQELAGKLSVPALPHAFLAACRYHAGRFRDAIGECDAAVAAAEAAESFIPASAPALAATIALRQGRLEEAERLTLRAEEVRTPAEFGGDTIVRWTRTLLHEANGQTEQAADAAAAALASYLRAGFASYLAWHAPDLVRVCLNAGRPEQAELAAAAADRAASLLPVASRRAGALRARGLLTNDPAILEQALAAARDAGRPIDLALTLRDTAAALTRNGQPQRARALATEALQLLRDLDAAGEEQSARSLLRAAGLSLSARSKHTRAQDGWDSLTEAELKIVAQAAQGRTNPQIAQALYLSPRTVGRHLSNIFSKLGVTSRGQLTAEAVRRDLS
jgi:ATP/maltotriose-dependent transcriptional regulator MalT